MRKANGDLLSVTQKDAVPLAIGQKVLVIAGNQARVVPDYTVPGEQPPKPTAAAPTGRPDDNGAAAAAGRRRAAADARTSRSWRRGPDGQAPSQGGPFSSTMLPSGSGT